ncbi:MAG TPA: hypothetical protein VF627_04005, partial [Abditibacterium sp.]
MKISLFPSWMAGGMLAATLPASAQTAQVPAKPAAAPTAAPVVSPTAALVVSPTAAPVVSPAARQSGTLDVLAFGDSAAEAAHGLKAPFTETLTGALGQTARRALPRRPVDIYGGELLFSMKVDPARRNYFSIKLWGEETSIASRLLLYMTAGGADYQVGYRSGGDYLPLSIPASKAPLPGRFYYSTTLLPLAMTRGKTSVTLKIVATGRLNPAGAGSGTTGSNYQLQMRAPGQSIYRAYTHTEPMLQPIGEAQGAAPATPARPESSGALTAGVNAQIKALLNADATKLSPAEALYLARSYSAAGSAGYRNPAVVEKVAAILDRFSSQKTPDSKSAAATGELGNLGRAIEVLKAPLQAKLKDAAGKTRRAAWANLLFAAREAGRFNRSGLSHEAIAGDLAIYSANRGLLALGDARAFPEGAAQRYLREAAGLAPWLGSDLPNGGHEMRFGAEFRTVTAKGLTREWGYVGPARGEVAAHVIEMWELTGNPEFRAQAVKMVRARAPFWRPAVGKVGVNYLATVEGLETLAWHGVGAGDAGGGASGFTAPTDGSSALGALRVAAATLDPTLVGYARQMLVDGHFAALLADISVFSSWNAFQVARDMAKMGAAPGNARLPMTSGQPDFAWADEELGVAALKRGEERLWVAPFWQSKAGTGINGIGRFHFSTPRYDQIGVLETVPQFRARGLFVRPADFIDQPQESRWHPPNPPRQAYGNEWLPIGVAPLDARDDASFRGEVDFYAFRFGPYLFGMNRTGNRTFGLKTPSGFASAPNLMSGAPTAAPKGGEVPVAPR